MRLTKTMVSAVSTTTATRNFLHLKSIPRLWSIRSRSVTPVFAVYDKDRIKYWNIVPGDQVRVRGDTSGELKEVVGINRFSNKVFFKDPRKPAGSPKGRSIHYCRCELFVGNYDLKSTGGDKSSVVPVFAKRMSTSGTHYNPAMRRYDWNRFAAKTTPIIPYLKDEKIKIPWPKPDKLKPTIPTAKDTLKKDVLKITYKPPVFALSGVVPRPPSEFTYLKSIFNPARRHQLGASLPVETYLVNELSNPHSRAKKQARWQAYQLKKRDMLEEFTNKELDNLQGRSISEAKAEAIWRWKEQIEADKKHLKKKRRWMNKAAVAKVSRKNSSKDKREKSQRDRLTAMVLQPEHNQVVPAAVDLY